MITTIRKSLDRLLLSLLSKSSTHDLEQVLSLDLELCSQSDEAYLPVAQATCRLADLLEGQ